MSRVGILGNKRWIIEAKTSELIPHGVPDAFLLRPTTPGSPLNQLLTTLGVRRFALLLALLSSPAALADIPPPDLCHTGRAVGDLCQSGFDGMPGTCRQGPRWMYCESMVTPGQGCGACGALAFLAAAGGMALRRRRASQHPGQE